MFWPSANVISGRLHDCIQITERITQTQAELRILMIFINIGSFPSDFWSKFRLVSIQMCNFKLVSAIMGLFVWSNCSYSCTIHHDINSFTFNRMEAFSTNCCCCCCYCCCCCCCCEVKAWNFWLKGQLCWNWFLMKLDEVCQGKVSKKKVRNLIFGWVGVCPFLLLQFWILLG